MPMHNRQVIPIQFTSRQYQGNENSKHLFLELVAINCKIVTYETLTPSMDAFPKKKRNAKKAVSSRSIEVTREKQVQGIIFKRKRHKTKLP